MANTAPYLIYAQNITCSFFMRKKHFKKMLLYTICPTQDSQKCSGSLGTIHVSYACFQGFLTVRRTVLTLISELSEVQSSGGKWLCNSKF